jgi:hypothetical protein
MAERDDYEVGYKKPPLHTRFQKGRSGNPQGRPPGSSSVSTLLASAVRAKVTVVEGGRRVKKSKLEVAFTQMVNKAAGGDLKAQSLLMRLLPLLDPKEAQGAVTPDMAADRELARKLAARLAGSDLAPADSGEAGSGSD